MGKGRFLNQNRYKSGRALKRAFPPPRRLKERPRSKEQGQPDPLATRG